MNRAPHPPGSRFAAVGVALSLVAAPAPAALAADPVVAPVARAASAQDSSQTAPTGTPPNRPAGPPAKAPPVAPDEAAVDDDLIEFLGSIGDTTEEGDWLDFLSNTDIDKVAKRGSKTPPRGR